MLKDYKRACIATLRRVLSSVVTIWLTGSIGIGMVDGIYGRNETMELVINVTNTGTGEIKLTVLKTNQISEIQTVTNGQTKSIFLEWGDAKPLEDFKMERNGELLVTLSGLLKRKRTPNLEIDSSYEGRNECEVIPILHCTEITVAKHDIKTIN